jgi:hypothetical protein
MPGTRGRLYRNTQPYHNHFTCQLKPFTFQLQMAHFSVPTDAPNPFIKSLARIPFRGITVHTDKLGSALRNTTCLQRMAACGVTLEREGNASPTAYEPRGSIRTPQSSRLPMGRCMSSTHTRGNRSIIWRWFQIAGFLRDQSRRLPWQSALSLCRRWGRL